jgi:hypothetical protein
MAHDERRTAPLELARGRLNSTASAPAHRTACFEAGTPVHPPSVATTQGQLPAASAAMLEAGRLDDITPSG